jgi:hypothetical protein
MWLHLTSCRCFSSSVAEVAFRSIILLLQSFIRHLLKHFPKLTRVGGAHDDQCSAASHHGLGHEGSDHLHGNDVLLNYNLIEISPETAFLTSRRGLQHLVHYRAKQKLNAQNRSTLLNSTYI